MNNRLLWQKIFCAEEEKKNVTCNYHTDAAAALNPWEEGRRTCFLDLTTTNIYSSCFESTGRRAQNLHLRFNSKKTDAAAILNLWEEGRKICFLDLTTKNICTSCFESMGRGAQNLLLRFNNNKTDEAAVLNLWEEGRRTIF